MSLESLLPAGEPGFVEAAGDQDVGGGVQDDADHDGERDEREDGVTGRDRGAEYEQAVDDGSEALGAEPHRGELFTDAEATAQEGQP